MSEQKKQKMTPSSAASSTTTTTTMTTAKDLSTVNSTPLRSTVVAIPKSSPALLRNSKSMMDGKFCTAYKRGYYFGVDKETNTFILIRGDVPVGFTWEQNKYVRKVGTEYTVLEDEESLEFPMLQEGVIIDKDNFQYEGMVTVVISYIAKSAKESSTWMAFKGFAVDVNHEHISSTMIGITFIQSDGLVQSLKKGDEIVLVRPKFSLEEDELGNKKLVVVIEVPDEKREKFAKQHHHHFLINKDPARNSRSSDYKNGAVDIF